METSGGGPGRRRRPGGRHAGGRSRRGRRRRRAGRRGLALGALALAGGVAGLLGVNGTFDGTPAASRSAPPAASGQQTRVERDDGASALPGKAGTAGPRASASAEAEAREVQQAVPQETGKPGKPEETGGPVPKTTTDPNVVEGSAPPEEAVLVVPGMDDTDGYRADGPSSHTDRQAAEYFRTHWGPDDKAMKRLKDIRTVGGYLRIYTDLPATAHNSRHAITLCKRGLEYLRAAGVTRPVVFVQARFGENGNPVLANILGPSDRSCSVTHPAPD